MSNAERSEIASPDFLNGGYVEEARVAATTYQRLKQKQRQDELEFAAFERAVAIRLLSAELETGRKIVFKAGNSEVPAFRRKSAPYDFVLIEQAPPLLPGESVTLEAAEIIANPYYLERSPAPGMVDTSREAIFSGLPSRQIFTFEDISQSLLQGASLELITAAE